MTRLVPWRGGSIVALAAGLALAALPGSALARPDRGGEDDGGRPARGQSEGRGFRGGPAPAPIGAPAQGNAQAPAPRAEAPARVDDRRGGGGEARGGDQARGGPDGARQGWRQDVPRIQQPGSIQAPGLAGQDNDRRWTRDGDGRPSMSDRQQRFRPDQGFRPDQRPGDGSQPVGNRQNWNGNDARNDRRGRDGGDGRGGYDRRGDDRRSGDWRDRDGRVDNWRGDERRDGNVRNDGGRWNGGDARYAGNDRWNREWRNNNRYDWRGYRNGNRSHYRFGTYYSPYNNWSYRRLSVGFTLQPLFFSNNYWINDPYSYRLPPAYGPYRWVRYYDDALLVDIYSGEVVDTIYDIFW